jgi:excinuclease ABC subunit C
LEGVAERFGLPRVPRRVEVYDNSHIMGTNAVGAMIVAGRDGFVKNQYRKFNIKGESLTPGDDYAMMREVLTRRFKRLGASEAEVASVSGGLASPDTGEGGGDGRAERRDSQHVPTVETGASPSPVAPSPYGLVTPSSPVSGEGSEVGSSDWADRMTADKSADLEDHDDGPLPDTETFPDRPDLVLIDGGLGQLTIAREVFAELGITDIALVGVAKGPDRDAGREHFHIPGRAKSLMLEPRDPVLYFVQRLRDEAHRFVIGTHRAKRSKAMIANPLDEIDGIGPTRKRALLSHFGSAKAVGRAGVGDLLNVPGISAEMAQKVYDFFHEKP